MEVIVADFETYYDKEYSLSKISMEEYIRSPLFEVIMLCLVFPEKSRQVITGTMEEIQYQLDAIDFSDKAILCHNTLFDGAIFSWRFNIKPRLWLDTLSMGRAMFGNVGNSLSALAKFYKLGDKGTVVHNMMGRRRESLDKYEFDKYAEYCMQDCFLTEDIFLFMANGWYDLDKFDQRDQFPKDELKLIDLTIRMFTEPVFKLDVPALQTHLDTVRAKKAELLASVGLEREALMSNAKFAELLLAQGVTPPMKISPTTKKPTYAFAKTDEGMKALLEHPKIEVQALVAARLGVKSTIEETRTERFIGIGGRGLLPIPLRYCAAHTKRWGGTDGINMQNLPSRGANGGTIKRCIHA